MIGTILLFPGHLLPCPRTELRIDVERPSQTVDDELADLYHRLHRPGSPLHGLPTAGTDLPHLILRYREADGEYHVYVEDTVHRRLAGHTVFNRLVEVGRQADRLVRSPHSRYGSAYQRQGLASAVYRWGLDAGLCLVSGARQSAGAHALWLALARHYEAGYVDLRDRTLRYLGPQVSPEIREDLHTRLLLLGRGWHLARFAQRTGMQLPLATAGASPLARALASGRCLDLATPWSNPGPPSAPHPEVQADRRSSPPR